MKFENLKYPEQNKVNILGQDVMIKPYLTTGEINSIVSQMLQYENYIEREAVKGIAILKFCTDIDTKEKDYDLYRANGIVEEVMNYIREDDLLLIDETVCYEQSVNKTIKDFCDGINKNISEIEPNEMMEELVDNLKNLQDKQNAIQEH